jgi:hypothetical protein
VLPCTVGPHNVETESCGKALATRPIARRLAALHYVRMKNLSWIALIPFAVLFVGVLGAGCGSQSQAGGPMAPDFQPFDDAGDAGEQ